MAARHLGRAGRGGEGGQRLHAFVRDPARAAGKGEVQAFGVRMETWQMASQVETGHTQQEIEDAIGTFALAATDANVALIGWIGMLVALRGAVIERAWVYTGQGWVRTDGFDNWLAVLDNELFDVRQDMQAISDARSNTYDGELGYEC